MKRLLLFISLLLAACAKPPAPPLWIDSYRELIAEARDYFPGEAARQYLSVAETRFGMAQQLDADKKWDAAALSYHLASATAQVGLEAAKLDRNARLAKECELEVIQARQRWIDAVQELERTEKVAGRSMEATRESDPGFLEGLDYRPEDRPFLTLDEARSVVSGSARALRLAKSQGTSVSDLYGPMEHFSARALATVEEDRRAPYELLAARYAQAIQYRVAAAQAEERCRRSVDAVAHYRDLQSEAVWALVQLERVMKDSARQQLEEERRVMESQQNKLYNALKQFEGKFAQLTQEARGTILSMGDILFESGSAALTRQAQFNLVKVATILQQFPDMHIYVEGHSDDVGSAEANQRVSEERAQAVLAFLHEQGVPLERMDWYGYGMTKPVVPNTTPENRAKNRRVDLVIGEEND